MAVFNFSALADGQAISFDPDADVLSFDETAIAAADIRVVAAGSDARVTYLETGKEVTLLGVSPLQLATSNVTFADGSRLLFGDDSTALNDNLANTLTGSAGRDHLNGFGGADTMNGGAGDDSYFVTSGDVISDSGGIDTIFAEASFALPSTIENITYLGSANTASVGNWRPNAMTGNSGANYMEGRGDDDTLAGAAGNDTLVGGPGADVFAFAEAGSAHADNITDFASGVDKIRLDASYFSAIGAEGDFAAGDGRFRAGAGLNSGQDADDRVIYNTSTGELFYDADGSGAGASQLIATLTSRPALAASDIEVVGTDGGTPPPGDGVIRGTEGNDSLVGTDGDDSIEGLAGNDTLDGGPGADTMDGGAHSDIFYVDNPGDVVIEREGGGADDEVRSSISYTLPAWVNHLTLTGYDPSLGGPDAHGNELDNIIRDEGPGGAFLYGNGGNDTLIGGSGFNMFLFLGNPSGTSLDYGHDVVDGGGGVDWLHFEANTAVTVDFRSGTATGGADGASASVTFSNIEAAVSSRFDDLLIAHDSGVQLLGYSGNDTLIGGAGDDGLSGDGAFGHPAGDHGDDSLFGGAGNDGLNGDEGNDTLEGGEGNDTIFGGAGADRIVFAVAPGAANADRIMDFASNEDKIVLDGNAHANTGPSGDFTAEDARFFAGPGTDSGQDASDRVIYNTTTGELWYDADGSGSGAAQLIATLEGAPDLSPADIAIVNGSGEPGGGVRLVGTSGNDSLVGGDGNDTLEGLAGNDTLIGGEGDDWLDGGADVDTMDGGLGDDSYVVTAGDVLSDSGGIDTVYYEYDPEHPVWTLGAGFENLTITGFRETFGALPSPTGIGNELDNVIRNDGFFPGVFTDLDGGEGDDTLIGGDGTERFRFEAGAGNYGNDFVDGSAGTDYLYFGTSEIAVTINLLAGTASGGGAGSVTFVNVEHAVGGAGADLLIAGDEGHSLYAGAGNDTLIGGTGNDALMDNRPYPGLDIGSDDDSLSGGDGDDWFELSRGNDWADGGAGDDRFTILGSVDYYGDDTIIGGDGIDGITLYAASDTVVDLGAGFISGGGTEPGAQVTLSSIENYQHGTSWSVRITGSAAANVLAGAGGTDTLDGGAGNDTLTGGGFGSVEPDFFVFSVAPGDANADLIVDFGPGEDKIVLDGNSHANSGPSGDFIAGDARFFAAPGASTGQDASDRVIYNTTTGELWYDADGSGSGAAQLVATLLDAPSLTATDITIVNGSGGGEPGGGVHLVGTSGNDSLVGGDGDDTLEGLAGNDTLVGGEGDDLLDGGADADTMDGGPGDDTYVVTSGDVLIDSGGVDTVISSVSWSLGAGFENLVLTGTAGTSGFGNSLDNRIQGNAGANYIQANSGRDTVVGGAGNDTIGGNSDEDWLEGGAGNDSVAGGGGQDSFVFREAGAANADFLPDFASGWDRIMLDAGVFAQIGAQGQFASGDGRFHSAPGATSGQDADDRVIFNSSTGQLFYDPDGSGAAASQLIATMGSGRTVASHDVWVFSESSGGDMHLIGTSGNETLVGGPGNDTLEGLDGADFLTGNAGNDLLLGGAGIDDLSGGDGDDRLDGGPNVDWLTGGSGADTLVFSQAPGEGNLKLIRDFASGIDQLELDGSALWNLGPSGSFTPDDERFYAAPGAAAAHDVSDRVIFNTSNGWLYYDPDGTGSTWDAEHFATLQAGATLVASDIVVVNGTPSTGVNLTGTAGDDSLVGTSGDDAMEGLAGNDTLDGLGGNDLLIGNDGDDSLLGGTGNDDLEGRSGNDSISGGPGIDTLRGDEGNDTLDGGAGVDFLYTGSGADRILFTQTPGEANRDTISDFSSATDKLALDRSVMPELGNLGNFAPDDERFYAAPGATSGHDASDRLVYDTSNSWLYYDADGDGGIAAQRIASFVVGTPLAATDFEVVDSATGVHLTGTSGDDTLIGGPHNDTLEGLAGNDSLDGGFGADHLIGGDGNDTLDGSIHRFDDWEPFADTMDGGLGDDLFIVNNAADVLLDAGGVDSVYAIDMDWTLAAGFENLTLNNDVSEAPVTGIGNDLDNILEGTWHVRLEGRGGDDLLLGAARHDTLIGGLGNDTIRGDSGFDWLQGEAGNDLLEGELGDDTLEGGDGDDTLSGGEEFDVLTGGSGADSFIFDTLYGHDRVTDFETGADRIRLDATAMPALGASGTLASGDGRFHAAPEASGGHDADDRIVYNASTGELFYDADGDGAEAAQLIAILERDGSAAALSATDITVDNGTSGVHLVGTDGNDSLVGGPGDDTLEGLGGADTLNGADGDDTYIVTPGDTLIDSGGIDTILAESSFAIPSPVDNITYVGSANTSSSGNWLPNVMIGNSGANYLDGREGNDTLDGGAGNDTLQGASGEDSFVFSQAPGSANADLIRDFASGVDRLVLDAEVMAALGAPGEFAEGDGRFWAASGAISGHDADDRVVYDTSTGDLYYDADGSGAGGAQLVATLQGAPGLAASDISVI